MHKGVVYRLFMCESLSPGTSPVLMSHWVDYEVLGSAQESFLRQVQVPSRCLPMCHSDLAAMPAIRGCKPSFHLFPYSRCPRMKTRAHRRRDVCTQETVQQKVLGTGVGFEFFLFLWLSPAVSPLLWLPSPSTWLFLLSTHSSHFTFPECRTQVSLLVAHSCGRKNFLDSHSLKTLIKNAGELALFLPTA